MQWCPTICNNMQHGFNNFCPHYLQTTHKDACFHRLQICLCVSLQSQSLVSYRDSASHQLHSEKIQISSCPSFLIAPVPGTNPNSYLTFPTCLLSGYPQPSHSSHLSTCISLMTNLFPHSLYFLNVSKAAMFPIESIFVLEAFRQSFSTNYFPPPYSFSQTYCPLLMFKPFTYAKDYLQQTIINMGGNQDIWRKSILTGRIFKLCTDYVKSELILITGSVVYVLTDATFHQSLHPPHQPKVVAPCLRNKS